MAQQEHARVLAGLVLNLVADFLLTGAERLRANARGAGAGRAAPV